MYTLIQHNSNLGLHLIIILRDWLRTLAVITKVNFNDINTGLIVKCLTNS